jgi:hypothetical protein
VGARPAAVTGELTVSQQQVEGLQQQLLQTPTAAQAELAAGVGACEGWGREGGG